MKQAVRAAALVLLAALCAWRFVHLDADFPAGITRSGELFTDEGWYASAALNQRTWGHWYLSGDFNPAANLPVGTQLQTATFGVLGMSLASARFVSAAAFVVLLVGAYGLCRALRLRVSATLGILFLLAPDPLLFAYSRLAVLELPYTALVVAALWAASIRRSRTVRKLAIGAAFSGGLLALAALTKTSALAALPALIYLCARRGRNARSGALLTALALLATAVPLGAYSLWASRACPTDYTYFQRLNVQERAVTDPVRIARATVTLVWNQRKRQPVLFPLIVLLCVPLTLTSRRFRRSPLVHTAALWLGGSFLLLGMVNYHPVRYFVPLIVPHVLLLGAALSCLPRPARPLIPTAVLVLIGAVQVVALVRQQRTQEFTLVSMARDVGRIIRAEQAKRPVLIGHFAQTVSLETGIPAINLNLGTQDLDDRLAAYRPTFYLAGGGDPVPVNPGLNARYRLVAAGRWRVLDNYYTGQDVVLYRLLPRPQQKL